MTPEPDKPVGATHQLQALAPAFGLWRAGLGKLFVGLAAALCLAMSLLGWLVTSRLTESVAEGRFMGKASELALAVADHVAACEVALRGGYAFIKTVKGVDRRQWRDYCATLDLRRNYQAIQGLGYAPMVTEGGRQAHVQSVRGEGFPDYDIWPAGSRALYGPIIYLEPFDERNQRAFGYDMFSEATRKAAMERARDTGEPAISGKVTLVQEAGENVQVGFLMFFPVYSSSGRLDTLAERRGALQGFVYSPFRMNDFMEEVFGQGARDIGVDIFDGGEPMAPTLMFQSAPEHSPLSGDGRPRFTSLVRKEFFGRTWTMRFYSLPEFEAGVDRTVPLVTLALSLLVGLLFVVILLSLSDTQRKATAIADGMTADLRASEERIRLILSSTGEPIYGIGLKGECTFCNAACVRALGYGGPEELLGKNMHALIHHTRADGKSYPVKDCPIFSAFLRSEGVHVVDEHLWRADGTSFPAEYWSYPQVSDGKTVGAVVVFQDITQRKRAEEDAARLAGLVQAASRVAIIATDASGLVTVFNKGAENLLGYEAGEMLGAPLERIHLPEELKRQGVLLSQQLGRAVLGFEVLVTRVREGDFEARQWTYLRKDGAHVPVELVVTAVRDKLNRITGFVGVATDMGGRVKAEKALRRTKERFRKLAELSPVGIFETDTEGNCQFVNLRWQEMAGLKLRQALGQGWVSAIHPDDMTAFFTEWQAAMAEEREFSLEYRFMTPEGKVTWLAGSARAVRGESGEALGYFGTVVDISKRVAAEAAMRESEARLSAVLETAVDPILTVDAVGAILSANRAARATFGYEGHELEGRNVKILMPEPYHSNHDAYLERYRTTRYPHIIGRGGREVQGRTKGGAIIPIELSVSEFVSNGETFYTGILRNISERVRARDELLAANEMLTERQRRLDADLEAAAEIQRSLLPGQGACSLGLEYDFRFMPSSSIGGDIFNVVCLGAEHTALYMVDVSGHGVPAALVSVTLAQELNPTGDVLMDGSRGGPRQPEEVLRTLDTLFPMERFDKFFSMFYMLYEYAAGTLTYCNAGHPSPILLRADGRVELLEEGGTLVGLGLGETYAAGRLAVGEGDMLFVYTDGVTELQSPSGEQFGVERLADILSRHAGTPPEQVLESIAGKLQTHADGRPQDDDISIICVRFTSM